MMQEHGSPQINCAAHDSEKCSSSDFHGIPPIEVVAIYAYKREREHEDAPEYGTYPVNAEQWYLNRSLYRLDKYQYHEHHQGEKCNHDPMHILPLRQESGVDCGYTAQLDHSVDHKIHVAEEYCHVACRGEPQLDGGVACKGCPHTEPARHKTGRHQQRHVCSVRTDKIRGYQHRAAYQQAYSVGKTEFQPEHDAEVDRHTDERRITRHQYVFLHQCRGSNHISGGGKVHAP